MKVIAYIDGYNLYYGLRDSGWKWAYWLNLQYLIKQLIKQDQQLITTKYFTTIIKKPTDKRYRQQLYLEALQTLPEFQIFYGKFLFHEVLCKECGHTYQQASEKMTDVNIAVEMMGDAYENRYDTAILLSADSDLAGLVRRIRRLFPDKRVIAAFPPMRNSAELKQACNGFIHIGRSNLIKSLFPSVITKQNGFKIKKPRRWK